MNVAVLPGSTAASTKIDPSTRSSDRQAMDAHYRDVSTFLAGPEAVIRATTRYLPMFPRERDEDYRFRLSCAKFTNVFRDLLENLSSKPFARTVDLNEDAKIKWPQLDPFMEDVDGRGNHLHVFAGEVFFNAIAYSVDWIMVDKTPVARGATLAEERAAGARVYWYRIPAPNIEAVYSDIQDGVEIFTHVRVREDIVVRDGFGEKNVERIRIHERVREGDRWGAAIWTLMERSADTGEWYTIDSGEFGIGFIPLIPVMTGRRIGDTWRFVKTSEDLIHLQKKLYQNETNLEYAKQMAGSPMLSAKDVDPPTVTRKVSINGIEQLVEEPADVVVGPKTVLYGDWHYIQIDSNAIEKLEKSCDRLERQMREIGRQPLTTNSGNLTVVTTMFAAQKGNSAVQAWALGLKDRLELAFKYTALWMNLGDDVEPEVNVWTDFSIDLESEAAPSALQDAQKRRLISRSAYLDEMKRRNFLRSEYNSEEDAEVIRKEIEEYEFLEVPSSGGEVGSRKGSVASGGNSAVARVRADIREI